jgi:hypothetical protein
MHVIMGSRNVRIYFVRHNTPNYIACLPEDPANRVYITLQNMTVRVILGGTEHAGFQGFGLDKVSHPDGVSAKTCLKYC